MSNYFFLLKELIRRDFKSRYVGSTLGFLWAFVQPLWQLALYSFVFSTVLKIPLKGERTEDFAVFMFCGLLPWMAVSEGLMRATTAITDNADLVKKLSFPTEMLVLSVVVGGLIHEAIAAFVFVLVLLFSGNLNWPGLPLLLLIVPIQAIFTVGLGFLLCCVHTLFRDTAQMMNLVMTGWFFLTPIVYPLTLVPERYRAVLFWNPLTSLVDLYRRAFLRFGDTSAEVIEVPLLTALGPLILVALGFATLGWLLFRRLKPSFADEI